MSGQSIASDLTLTPSDLTGAMSMPGARKSDARANKKVTLDVIKEASGLNESLEEMVEVMNKAMKISHYSLKFSLHRESGEYQIQVINTDTDEIVRKIPPDVMLRLSANFKDSLDKAVGVLVNELG